MKSASAEVIPELSLELYEAPLALDNGCCQAFLLRLSWYVSSETFTFCKVAVRLRMAMGDNALM